MVDSKPHQSDKTLPMQLKLRGNRHALACLLTAPANCSTLSSFTPKRPTYLNGCGKANGVPSEGQHVLNIGH